MEELGPSQRIRNGVTAIFLDTLLHEISIALAKVALLGGSVGEIDDDEPGTDSDDLGNETLNNLPKSERA